MCNSALHQVTEVLDGARVLAKDLNGTTHQVSLLAFDGDAPRTGTWLIVHSGYAIDSVEEYDAQVALAELRRVHVIDAPTSTTTHSSKSKFVERIERA
jgi:hydrogenase maturation factor